jgi:hypothetical protein
MRAKTNSPQRGQAMVEALIACALVLVPLFLAIPIIAKYLDIRSHVVQAARYAAWERTVWFGGDAASTMGLSFSKGADSILNTTNKWNANAKDDNAIRAEIGSRLLSNTDANASFSNADQGASTSPNYSKPLWRDRGGNSLLSNYSDIAEHYDNNTAPGLFSKLFNPIMQVASVVSDFTVETHGQYVAQVGVAVQQVAFNPDTGMAGCPGCPTEFLATGVKQSFSETNVIVANGWSANGPGSLSEYGKHPEKITVYNQVRGLTPSALLNPPSNGNLGQQIFSTVITVLKDIALIFFPELSTLDLGRIEVDKVPPDRVK